MPHAAAIEATILDLLADRADTASICPSEAARALAEAEPAWRALMPRVREIAASLATRGMVVVTQGETVCDPATPWQGPVRLRRGPAFPG